MTVSRPNARSVWNANIGLAEDECRIVARPVRILIADDFDGWRVETANILQQQPEWQIVSEANDGLQAVEKAAELRPDVVLLDIGMPGLNGLETARRIRQNSPDSHIIFVTQLDDAEIRTAALDSGAVGYVLKINAGRQLVRAVLAAIGKAH